MRKFKMPGNNLIIGVLLGYVLWYVIQLEAYFINFYLEKNNLQVHVGLVKILSIILGVIVFILVVKRFYRLKAGKLSFYFISSIIFSVFITVQIFLWGTVIYSLISTRIYSTEYEKFLISDIGSFIMGNFIAINLLLLIGVGLVIFTLLINRKVKYIKYITREIKKIEDEGFGRTINVKGNDELSELSQSINRMSTKIKEQIEKEKIIENNKNELITNVSHDLRTPLTSINGYIELLKENGFKDKEKFDEYIAVVDRRTKGLTILVNELFEYTKLNNDDIKLNLVNIDIVTLVSHIANEYSIIFEKNGLTLERNIINKEIFMNVDVDKIVRVFQNVLSNANKYSIKNSTIVLVLAEEQDNVIISLSNRTDEINESDLPNIFNRFYKADKSRSEHDSSGLGLSITKRIIELHHGSISVDLKGDIITFKISIPKEENSSNNY